VKIKKSTQRQIELGTQLASVIYVFSKFHVPSSSAFAEIATAESDRVAVEATDIIFGQGLWL
jgi:hypothetical protein